MSPGRPLPEGAAPEAAGAGRSVPPPDAASALHATCVAVEGRGVLLVGPSGAGKSALALRLIALGAELVADDRTLVARHGDRLVAAAPASGHGLIEARGVGLLRLPALGAVPLALAVDLGQPEPARMPPPRSLPLLGLALPLLHRVEGAHFPAAILLYLRHGGVAA